MSLTMVMKCSWHSYQFYDYERKYIFFFKFEGERLFNLSQSIVDPLHSAFVIVRE